MQIDAERNPVPELTDDEKIDIAAAYILNRYLPAFEELANGGEAIHEDK